MIPVKNKTYINVCTQKWYIQKYLWNLLRYWMGNPHNDLFLLRLQINWRFSRNVCSSMTNKSDSRGVMPSLENNWISSFTERKATWNFWKGKHEEKCKNMSNWLSNLVSIFHSFLVWVWAPLCEVFGQTSMLFSRFHTRLRILKRNKKARYAVLLKLNSGSAAII